MPTSCEPVGNIGPDNERLGAVDLTRQLTSLPPRMKDLFRTAILSQGQGDSIAELRARFKIGKKCGLEAHKPLYAARRPLDHQGHRHAKASSEASVVNLNLPASHALTLGCRCHRSATSSVTR